MRTDFERIAKYIAKTVPTTVGLKVAAQLAVMKSGFTGAIENLAEVEIKVQGALNGKEVPTIEYPFYMNFARELFARFRAGISGPSLLDFATALVEKYGVAGYGLDDAHLKQIAMTCFTIVVPNGA